MSNKVLIRNIVLTGYMGVGKTTIGKQLARELGYRFIDMDSLLELREGRTIRAIFEAEGEAYFRHLESELCHELAMWRGYVIATGGGALVNGHNLAAFEKANLVVCLDCDPEALWERLSEAENRPMLDSDNPKARLFELLVARQPAYAKIQYHVDTSWRPTEDVVADICAFWTQANT